MPLTSRSLTETIFAIPGDLASPTGGYAYDRRVLAHLPAFGLPVRHVALPASYPSPSPGDLEITRKVLASTPPDATLLIDGLAYGAMPEHVIRGLGHRIVALVHHPLCLESGLSDARRDELAALERQALAAAAHVIVTSRTPSASSPPTSPCPSKRSRSPSRAPTLRRARPAPAPRCNCSPSALSPAARPMTRWCVHLLLWKRSIGG